MQSVEILSCIKQQIIDQRHIKGMSTKQLKELKLSNKLLFKNSSDIFLGIDTRELFNFADSEVKDKFLEQVKNGYLGAGQALIKKLPLDNSTLMSLSFLNPDERTGPGSISQITHLINVFNHLLDHDEKAMVEEEVRAFVMDNDLPVLGSSHVDLWWNKITKFPTLQKVAKAALSLFHGPQVESSFSLMKDIMNKKAGSMSVPTFDSIQTVKYFLKAKDKSSLEYFKRPSINHTPVDSHLVNNVKCATKAYTANLAKKREELEKEMGDLKMKRVKIQTAAEARRRKEKAIEIANKKHLKGCLKRKFTKSKNSLVASKKRRCE